MEFEFFQPVTVSELKKLLGKKKKNAYIFAGGTDLLVKMRHKAIVTEAVIDIKKISSFSRIEKDKKYLSVGSTVILNEIAGHPEIKKYYPALALGAASVGSYQIRNRATIAGNICNSSPAADTVPPLLIYNAMIKIISPKKTRIISIHEFFKGPGKNVLRENECVEAILLPYPGGEHSSFLKFSRRKAVDLSTVSVAAGIFNCSRKKQEVRIAVGACAPVTSRAKKAEEYLMKKGISQETIEKASLLLPLKPISDLRGSRNFREKIARNLFIKVMNEFKSMVKE